MILKIICKLKITVSKTVNMLIERETGKDNFGWLAEETLSYMDLISLVSFSINLIALSWMVCFCSAKLFSMH
jgi:hypothetical protein